MSTNISKLHRDELLNEIKEIRTHLESDTSENANKLLVYLSNLEKDVDGKKYGLVFEEHEEKVDVICRKNVPILKEVEELKIDKGGTQNFLIEGDNLASLKLLEKTHKGRIDCIIIDPPYNTGRDFVYNDTIISRDDNFKHSKWSSFMINRLKLAYKLLSKEGVLFINIDDYEYSVLRLLCEQVFGESNVQHMIWRKSGVGRDGKMKNTTTFRIDHEYVIVCFKQVKYLNKLLEKPNYVNTYPNPDDDPRGNFKAGSISKKENASNPNSPNFYSVTSPSGKVFTRQFDFSKEEFDKYNNDILLNKYGQKVSRIYWGKNGNNVPALKIFINEIRAVTPYSVLDNAGTTTEGTKELNELLKNDFSSLRPKPSRLYSVFVQLATKKDSIILDFFAGSGTTGQAVLNVNKTFGGERKFILCTNNENNICRDITYKRIKKVIENENYYASLKYMQVDYIPINEQLYYEYADKLLLHVKELVELENGLDFDGNTKVVICLTDDDLSTFVNKLENNSSFTTVYIGHNVLISAEIEKQLLDKNIEIHIIPDYYYGELKE